MTKQKEVMDDGLEDQLVPKEILKPVEIPLESWNDVKTQFTEHQERIYPANLPNKADVCGQQEQHFHKAQVSLQEAKVPGRAHNQQGCAGISLPHPHFLCTGCCIQELRVTVEGDKRFIQMVQSFISLESSSPGLKQKRKAEVSRTGDMSETGKGKVTPNIIKPISHRIYRLCPLATFGRGKESRLRMKSTNWRTCQQVVDAEFRRSPGKTDIYLHEQSSLLNIDAKMKSLRKSWLKLHHS